jgi:hypothetical protein
MKHRLLTGLAVVPLSLAVLTAGPADAVAGVRVTTLSGAQGWRVSPHNTGEVAISGAVDDPVRKDGIAGGNFFTTLSYQPQLDRGLGTGTWRSFANKRGAAVWWSSRARGSIPSNGAHYNFAATPKPVTASYDMVCEHDGGGTVTITAANNTASTQKLDVSGAGLTPHNLRITVPPNGKASGTAHIGTKPTVVTAQRVGGGSKSATLHGCPAEAEGVAPEQTGDLTPGVPGKAGGGFAANPQPEVGAGPGSDSVERQPVSVEMAATVSDPRRQAADSVAMLAGGMVAAAVVAFAGMALVRRGKDVQR